MGGSPKKVKPPAPMAPIPMPQEVDVAKKSEDMRRKLMARAGRQGTVLVPLGNTDSGKSNVLGLT